MKKLPVIVSQGGISSAGRTSNFHSFRRLIIDNLSQSHRQETIRSLAALMKIDVPLENVSNILSATLIRKMDDCILNKSEYLHNLQKKNTIHSAAMLPKGFIVEELYSSRNHPKAIAMTVVGASDALKSLGLDWDVLKRYCSLDQISVYAGSAMGQLDNNGYGGMLKSKLQGKRVSSKQCPLGMSQMHADFINAYLIGSLGSTGSSAGACASLLYNLRQGVHDIQAGRSKVVIVGCSEAPILSEIIDGYASMGALATDDNLRKLDNIPANKDPYWHKACRPFANNVGFVLAESAQFLILMDDELAMKTGASIYGSVADVFINADGFKKSISSPGAGNYLTLARATAMGRAIVGEDYLRVASFVQAHGTGTPQNRTTESMILSRVAGAFGIKKWPITAVKSYMGHSIGAAAGDQIMATLGVWKYGILPKIANLNELAPDVSSSHLDFLQSNTEIDLDRQKVALINAKGFGGNNATALLLSPLQTIHMLKTKYSAKSWLERESKHEYVQNKQESYENECQLHGIKPIYHFGDNVLTNEDIKISDDAISINSILLDLKLINPYW